LCGEEWPPFNSRACIADNAFFGAQLALLGSVNVFIV